ncbi:transposable element Tcb2 transposase [Trichonephila clavipes]|nr:transposable element Tcb2 transposase [Trichonephila clavipes]
MMLPVVQSVNGLGNARFTVWVSGVVNLREYLCLVLVIWLHSWPEQESTEAGVSPDLNPIELLWDVLEQDVKDHHTIPTNLTELWTDSANIRQIIPMERFQNLVESMTRRVATVVKARGGPTRY